MTKEKDDLIETLKQRENIIHTLRVENEQLNNRMMEMTSRGGDPS
jgi:hypothetical protein